MNDKNLSEHERIQKELQEAAAFEKMKFKEKRLAQDIIFARVSCLSVNHVMAMRMIVKIAEGDEHWPERENRSMNDILDALGMPKCSEGK